MPALPGAVRALLKCLLYIPVLVAVKVVDALLWVQGKIYDAKNTPFLLGGYAPVEAELLTMQLDVEGRLPAGLHGAFVRNGPNPVHIPKGFYHWFDGDGMTHAVRLHPDGTVSYCNRWVRTRRLELERRMGKPMFLRIGDMYGRLGFLRVLLSMAETWVGLRAPPSLDDGTANTALVYHDRRLLALVENALPYHIRVRDEGQLETVGLYSFQEQLRHPFTAHPKVDPETGDLLFFGYNVRSAPFLQYSRALADGSLASTVSISLPRPVMMHDFAITERFAVFMDLPLVFDPAVMVRNNSSAFHFDSTLPARIGVLPRDACDESAMRWFNVSNCFVFHTANAWEEAAEDGRPPTIVLIAARYRHFSMHILGPRGSAQKDPLARARLAPELYEWRLDLDSGAVTERVLAAGAHGEFPVVHPQRLGRSCRYAYMAALDPGRADGADNRSADAAGLVGITKVELQTGEVAGRIVYPEGVLGGEATFVPRVGSVEEDDGYLLTYLYSQAHDRSSFAVFDARSMRSEPLAKVQLPQRVPFGFHGTYLTEEQVKAQR